MRLMVKLLVLAGLGLAVCWTTAHGQAASNDPTQLGARQLEVRALDVPFETAYRAVTQAMFSLGYSISHSDKASGILTGTRTVGVTEMKKETKKAAEEMKQYQEKAQQEQTTKSFLSFVPYVGLFAALIPNSKPPEQKDIQQPSVFQATMLLQAMGEKQTQIRFKLQKDGEPIWDQITIDQLWVTTQREAMIESSPPQTRPATNDHPAQKPDAPTPDFQDSIRAAEPPYAETGQTTAP